MYLYTVHSMHGTKVMVQRQTVLVVHTRYIHRQPEASDHGRESRVTGLLSSWNGEGWEIGVDKDAEMGR